MKNKGFTLIELLAVIVILAIIALIAVPIIINIINGTKEKSKEIGKDLYLKAVEQAILKKNLKEEFNPSTCTVQKDGNLDCNGTTLVVEVEGEKPCSGTITITKGLVTGENIGYCDGTQTTPSNPTAQEKLESLLDEDNTDEIFEDGNGNIRYRGKTPNNYVEFNNETWRIIGYVDNHIKLIRNESIGSMAWDTSGGEYGSNDWTRPADLMANLNPQSADGTDTDGYYWTNNLTPEAKNMIGKTTWHLGGFDTGKIKASEAYTSERTGTTWEGYVGLMYPSDYGYAASEECMTSKTLRDYGDETCTSSNWLYLGIVEWTQSPRSSRSYWVWFVNDSGFLNSLSNNAYFSYGVRPVINLKSEVKIVDGTGKEDDPYILELK